MEKVWMTNVDTYLSDGCGRCPLGGTPQCKVHNWAKELRLLRQLVLKCGLDEEVKWSVPCYTHKKKNILIVSALKEYCVLSFFKGSLLKDSKKILELPGENTQAARVIRFTTAQQIVKMESTLKAYIHEAIEVEKAGLKADFSIKSKLVFPDELTHILNKDSKLKAAFQALTPGRQRGYILHFSQPKQSKTRTARIEKCIPKILEGRGFHD